jgi:hypothetical protein
MSREGAGMFAAEAYVTGSRELLALEVHPVRLYTDLSDFLGCALRWQDDLLRTVFDPDPFDATS